jgi:hypothetical protein
LAWLSIPAISHNYYHHHKKKNNGKERKKERKLIKHFSRTREPCTRVNCVDCTNTVFFFVFFIDLNEPHFSLSTQPTNHLLHYYYEYYANVNGGWLDTFVPLQGRNSLETKCQWKCWTPYTKVHRRRSWCITISSDHESILPPLTCWPW